MVINQKKRESKMASIEVNEIYFIRGVGVVLTGKVVEGDLKSGSTFELNGKQYTFGEIEANHEKVNSVSSGILFGVTIPQATREEFELTKGEILYYDAGEGQQFPNNFSLESKKLQPIPTGPKSFWRRLFGR